LSQKTEVLVILASLHRFDKAQGSDRRTDGQTNTSTMANTCAVARKNLGWPWK